MLSQKRDFLSISTCTDDELASTGSQSQTPSSGLAGNNASDSADSPKICFGMVSRSFQHQVHPDKILQIHQTAVKILNKSVHSYVSNGGANNEKNTTYLHFHLEQEDNTFSLSCGPGSVDGNLVAALNQPTGKALLRISRKPSIGFDVYISRSLWFETFEAVRITQKDLVLPANINVYGDVSIAGDVGSGLSTPHTYLQKPLYMDPSMEYQNPHYLRFPGIKPQREVAQRVGSNQEALAESAIETGNLKENLKNEFAVVFSSLIRSYCLVEIDAHTSIRTRLLP